MTETPPPPPSVITTDDVQDSHQTESTKPFVRVCKHSKLAGKCNVYSCPAYHSMTPATPFLPSPTNFTAPSSPFPFTPPSSSTFTFTPTSCSPGMKRRKRKNPSEGNHNIPEPRKVEKVCKFWVSGQCSFGHRCRYLHPPFQVVTGAVAQLVARQITDDVLNKSHDEEVGISGSETEKVVTGAGVPLGKDDDHMIASQDTDDVLNNPLVEEVGISGSQSEKIDERQIKRTKLDWDDETSRMFCEVCFEEIRAGNAKEAHLSDVGWKNVVEKFHLSSGKRFDELQLRNKWKDLVSDFAILKNHVNEPEFDEPDDTEKMVNASALEVAGVKKRRQSLPNPTPFDVSNLSEEPTLRDRDIEDKDQDNTPCAASCLNDDTVTERQPVQNAATMLNEAVSSRSEGKHNAIGGIFKCRVNSEEHLQCEIKRLLGSMDGYSRSVVEHSQRTDIQIQGHSIMDCIKLLNNTPSVEIGSELYMLGTRLFMK